MSELEFVPRRAGGATGRSDKWVARSLREMRGGLAACEGKLWRQSVTEPPKPLDLGLRQRTLPWELCLSVLYGLLQYCQSEAAGKKRKFRSKHKLLPIVDNRLAEFVGVRPGAARS